MSKSFTSFKVLSAAAISLSLSACAFKKDEGPSEEQLKISRMQAEMDANRPLLKADFNHEFIPNENDLNDYTAHVTWPAARPLQIKYGRNDHVIDTVDGRTKNSFDIKCENGVLEYQISVASFLTGVLTDYIIKMKCPFDYVVDQGISNVELLKGVTGKLVLKNGSTIAVSDSALELNLRALVIDGSAKITTFNGERSSMHSNPALIKPPSILINAKKASGELRLELNGLDGYKRSDWSDTYDPQLNGTQGAAGTFKEVCRTIKTKDGEVPGNCSFVCETPPMNGNPGLQPTMMVDGKSVPKKGEMGRDGVAGVGTSKVDLQIGDATGLTVNVAFNPGLASKPGKGGLPKGGKGGPPGTNPHGVCKSTLQQGPDGPDGVRGDDGKEASNGRCEGIYISPALVGKVNTEDINKKLRCSSIPGIVQVGKLIRE